MLLYYFVTPSSLITVVEYWIIDYQVVLCGLYTYFNFWRHVWPWRSSSTEHQRWNEWRCPPGDELLFVATLVGGADGQRGHKGTVRHHRLEETGTAARRHSASSRWTGLTEEVCPTCLMLKLDTDMIMVGLWQISSGLTQREKTAFCLGDSASFPHLSLEEQERKQQEEIFKK